MPQYTATVTVRLKTGVLDPEAETTHSALERLGFTVDDVRFADQYELELTAESATAARDRVDAMATQLLANPTIHEYTIDLTATEGQ